MVTNYKTILLDGVESKQSFLYIYIWGFYIYNIYTLILWNKCHLLQDYEIALEA